MKEKTGKLIFTLALLVVTLGNYYLAFHYYDRSDLFAFVLFRVVIVLAALGFYFSFREWRKC